MSSNRTVGRPKGTRNRNVVNARRAIADFVETNIPRFNGWLENVADGIPKRDQNGRPLIDSQGSVVYVVKPDPAQALKLVADICEFHLPKLSRSEATVVAKVEATDPSQMSTPELQRQLMIKLGLGADVIEVEPVEVPEKASQSR